MRPNIRFVLFCFWPSLMAGQTVQSTGPAKPRRVELRAIEVKKPEAPKPQPGESVEIDRLAGVVRLRAACSDGTVRLFESTLPSLIDPQVVSVQRFTADGNTLYVYHVSNGASARQQIEMFAVGMNEPGAALRTGMPEQRWRPGMTGPVPGGLLPPSRIWWTRDAEKHAIAAGKTDGPFEIVTAELPGLSYAHFLSDISMTYPSGFHAASEWAHERFNEVLEKEHFVRVPTIGPTISRKLSRKDMSAAIQAEFRKVSELPEFAGIRKELLAAAERVGGPGEDTLKLPQGQSPLQREFVAAMAINIAVLRSLK